MYSKLFVFVLTARGVFAQSSSAAATTTNLSAAESSELASLSSLEASGFSSESAVLASASSSASAASASESSALAGTATITTPTSSATFASGTTTVGDWLSFGGSDLIGSIVDVKNCETTIAAICTALDDCEPYNIPITYTQGPLGYQYVYTSMSSDVTATISESCSFTTSLKAYCTYVQQLVVRASLSTTDTFSSEVGVDQASMTITGGASKLGSTTGSCTPVSASTSGSALAPNSASTSTPTPTHNAAPVHTIHKAVGVGAAALAGLALL